MSGDEFKSGPQKPADSGQESDMDLGNTTATPRPGNISSEDNATTAMPGGSGSAAAMDVGQTARTPKPGSQPAPKAAGAKVGHSFVNGELASNRYRIIRFIAAGGMGEVYEAEDVELKKRVALKTIRPEIAEDKDALDRFKREIHLAHKITHSYVCRIFDIFHHTRETDSGQKEDIVYLSMELLEGETIAQRLKRKGPMTIDEARPLVRQMASALAAAHRAGVVHRDFKTANVVLVPDMAESCGFRVAVADFGLARAELSRDAFAAVSQQEDGMIVGTPAYMAPEQVEAGEITPAADIYALGIVFYEMLSGKLPFSGETPLSLALKRLEEKPQALTEHVPNLEAKWDSVISRCLELKPEDRYADAKELLDYLDAQNKLEEQKRLKKRLAIPMAIVTAFAVGAGFLISSLGWFGPTVDSVAVLGFKNVSGRPAADWMSTALSEMLVAEMAVSGEMRVIPDENVTRMKRELDIASVEALGEDKLTLVSDNLGTDLLLVGSYLSVGDVGGGKVRLVVHVQDASKGETVETFTINGDDADLFALIEEAGTGLRSFLKMRDVTDEERGTVRAAFPQDPEAARLYSQGLKKLRVWNDALGARKDLEAAILVEPDHPMPHAALANVWVRLGYDKNAEKEAEIAFEHSSGLPERKRLEVEAMMYRTMADWDREAALYQKVWADHPKDLEAGLQLAKAQIGANKGEEALQTLAALRKLREPQSDDPRIDLVEADAADSISDYEWQNRAAETAAEKGRAQGASLLVARAMLEKALALLALGKPDEAMTSAQESQRLYQEAGEKAGVGQALIASANIFYRQGNLDDAKVRFEEALIICRETGDQNGIAAALNNLATVLYAQDDLEGARKQYEECLAIKEEVGDLPGVSRTLTNLANVHYALGDLGGAGEKHQQALAIARDIDDKQGQALAYVNISELLLADGKPVEAADSAKQAVELSREIGWKMLTAASLAYWGDALVPQDKLDAATERYAEALLISTEIEAIGFAAVSERGLAQVSLEKGHFDEAAVEAEKAARSCNSAGSAKDEAKALSILARSLLASGKNDAAENAKSRAQKAVQKSENKESRLIVETSDAMIRAATGRAQDVAAARGKLDEIATEALEAGFQIVALEAELQGALIELKTGDAAAGRQRLESLAVQAAQRQLSLIERKALEALD